MGGTPLIRFRCKVLFTSRDAAARRVAACEVRSDWIMKPGEVLIRPKTERQVLRRIDPSTEIETRQKIQRVLTEYLASCARMKSWSPSLTSLVFEWLETLESAWLSFAGKLQLLFVSRYLNFILLYLIHTVLDIHFRLLWVRTGDASGEMIFSNLIICVPFFFFAS